jgi:hypothetical protein
MTVWIFGSFEGFVAELLRILENASLTVLRCCEPDRLTWAAHEKSATARSERAHLMSLGANKGVRSH